MAWLTLKNIALLILGCVIVKFISSVVRDRRFAAFAKQHGCEPPPETRSNFISGFVRLRRMMRMKETGEDVLDDILAEDLAHAATIRFTTFDGAKALLTVEPANLQAVLASQFEDFSVGHRRYNTFKPLIGHSIFSSDGAFWAHSRALFRPQFARENINDLEMTAKATTDLITAIGAPGPDGWTDSTAMMPLLYNFTLDTATDFLFGESVESQKLAIIARKDLSSDQSEFRAAVAQMKEAQEFAVSFGVANEYIMKRIRLQSFYWLGDGPKFRKSLRSIKKVTNRYVQLAMDTASSAQKPEGRKQSLLYDLATQTKDQTELRHQTLAILLAGRDTTASLLAWSLCRLSIHPEIFSKLRDIVLHDFKPGTEITFAKLKGCRYLQHFLNEILRLHPTVPINQRIAVKDTTLPVGGGPDQRSPLAVRKGQSVLFSVYNMQRREQLWGLDAAQFKPERWEQRYPAWQFIPFLGGPRICLGQQFALTEASYLIVRLLHQFDAIEPADISDMRKLKKALGVTMWPLNDCKVRFHKAQLL